MEKLNSKNYEIISFDCYGTLVDWSQGITEYLMPVFLAHDAHVIDSWVIEYFANIEPNIQKSTPSYEDVLVQVLESFADRLGFTPTKEEVSNFAKSVAVSKPFDDTVDSLKALQQEFDLVIISNTDSELFALTQKSLDINFSEVITSEEVGAYKPDPKIFDEALKKVKSSRVLHVAQSLYHDIQPASAAGIDTVRIDRYKGGSDPAQTGSAKPTWSFDSLADFANALLND